MPDRERNRERGREKGGRERGRAQTQKILLLYTPWGFILEIAVKAEISEHYSTSPMT